MSSSLPFVKSSGHFETLVSELLDHELAGFGKLYQKDRQIKNLIVIGGNLRGLMTPYQEESPQDHSRYEGSV